MTVYFEITGGMPAPLVANTTEMYFAQEGSGGRVGFTPASTRRNAVMIDNTNVANLFRAHLQRARARFTESRQAPPNLHFHTFDVPTRAEVEEKMDEFMAQLHMKIMAAILAHQPRRPKRRGRK